MGFRTSSARRSSAQSAVASSIVVLPDTTGTGPTLSGSGVTANTTINKQIVTVGTNTSQSTTVLSGVTVTSVFVTDSSFNNLDDTALDPAGGYLKIIGNGFKTGCTVYLNGSSVTTTLISSTELRVTTPSTAAGTYNLMVFNPDGNGAIYLNLGVSNFPAYTTSAGSLGTVYETNPYTQSVVATGDAPLVYSLFSGSLPPNATLSSNGVISGTSPVENASNTYSFVVNVKDAQGQDSTRSFSLTISTDTVTWSSPANNAVITLEGGTAMSNVSLAATSAAGKTITYTANTLPNGVSLSGNTISGIPTTEQTVYTELTATANTTNRTAKRYVSWVVNLGDAYFSFTSLLLSAKTTVQAPSFINDNSTNKLELIPVGDTRPSNFNPYMGGYYSNYFDGTGDYLTLPTNAAFAIGTADFTVEMWVMPTATNLPWTTLFAGVSFGASSDWGLYGGDATTSLYPMFFFTSSSSQGNGTNQTQGSQSLTGYTRMTIGQWNHIAVSRVSGTARMFLNGTQTGPSVNASTWSLTNSLQKGIGGGFNGNSNTLFTGYISNLRVVSGTGLYSANFTPSTTPLSTVPGTILLTCQDNRLIDDSPNNFAVTKNGDTTVSPAHPFTTPTTVAYNTQYSTFFNGSSYAFLSNQVALGSGNFTIEFWANFRDVSSGQNLYEGRPNGANGAYPTIYILSGTIRYFVSSTDRITSGTILTNNWYHIAVVRNSGTTTMYINGVSAGTYSDSTTYLTGDSRPLIASYNGSGGNFTGTISNLRVVTGTAVYTSNFTPSTTPLTAIANTTLLTCQSTSLIDNSTNNFAITTVGTQPIAVSPFTMTTANTTITNLGSAYFDGTGDYITPPPTSAVAMGSGDFTIDFWVYPHSVVNSGIFQIFTSAFPSSISGSLCLAYNSGGGGLNFTFNGTSGFVTVAQQTYTWTHFAIAKSGGTIRLYQNGIQISSQSDTATYSGTYLVLGGYWSTSYLHTGYISDFRIVKGNALYTRNFLPPQAPLTAVANTQLLTVQTNGGATNSGFVDQSSFNNIINKAGNPSQGTFSPYGNNWSNYFDGSGDFLSVPTTGSQLDATGDFTTEMWIYWNSMPTTGYQNICGQGAAGQNSYGLYAANAAGNTWSAPYKFKLNIANVGDHLTGDTTLVAGQWYHLAHTRTSGVNRLFVNGVLQSSTYTDSTSRGFGGNAYTIGNSSNCYISNFRYIKGTSLYTTTFTPPTAPLTAVSNTQLLTCNTNRFIDESPNNLTVTRNGDTIMSEYSPFTSVIVPKYYSTNFSSSAYTTTFITGGLGSGDFTIEGWIYLTASPTNNGIFHISPSNYFPSGSSGVALSFYGSGWHIFHNGFGDSSGVSTMPVLNRWYHFAQVRSSGTFKTYVDGVQVYSASDTTDFTTTTYLVIGGYWSTSYPFPGGNISNFRIVRGTALYTGSSTTVANFTVPTGPLTAVANTVFLGLQSNKLVDNSTNSYVITPSAVANIKPLAVSPFTPVASSPTSYSSGVFGGSIYLPDTSTYPFTTGTTSQVFGTGDFTVECWIYPTATAHNMSVVGTTTNTWGLLTYDNVVYWQFNGGNAQSGGTVPQKMWSHIAVSRTSGVTKGFLNGVQIFSAADTNNYSGSPSRPIGSAGGTAGFYMSDFRVVRGKGLYTSNFYPSTTPLTAIEYSNNSTSIANTAYASFLLSCTSGGVIDATRGSVIETSGTVKVTSNTSPFATSTQSYYFDGSTGRLIIPASPNLSFGTGDFTVEFWMRTTDTSAGLIVSATTGSGYWALLLSGGTLYWQSAYNATNLKTQSMTGYLNDAWVHVAIVRSSGSLNFYLNGTVQGTSTSDTTNYNGTANGLVIGRDAASNGYYSGYLTDLRITKGYARYTTNFTVPSGPLSEK